jgi:hypothetical protein
MEPWMEHFAAANFRRSADTAHDLKTPLNVAVLNLELLRMRLRKLEGQDDEKIAGYASALELELRRLGRIFDAFFLLSTPPKSEGAPEPVEITSIVEEAAAGAGVPFERGGAVHVCGHASRIRQAVKMFFEGAAHVFDAASLRATGSSEGGRFQLTIHGRTAEETVDPAKIFKFYYTDPQGNPDLSLASARLIAETYGGELSAIEERDKVIGLRLSLLPGE